MSKLVSILIPLYNAEKYIEETIKSCINQTYKNCEIIVLDDGSTDNSFNIAKEFEKLSDKVKVFSHQNAGAQITRNKLFELSTGDYIQYLDADDLLDKNKIKHQMELLKNEPSTTVSFCKWKGFRNEKENICLNNDFKIYKDYENPINLLIEMWSNIESIIPHAWIVHRDIIKESAGWDLNLKKNQDGEFFSRIIISSEKILFSNKSLVYYRLDSENSISKNLSYESTKSLLESINLYKKNVSNFLNNYETKYALAKQYSHFIFLIYPQHKELREIATKEVINLGFNDILPTKNYLILKILYKILGSRIMTPTLKRLKNAIK